MSIHDDKEKKKSEKGIVDAIIEAFTPSKSSLAGRLAARRKALEAGDPEKAQKAGQPRKKKKKKKKDEEK